MMETSSLESTVPNETSLTSWLNISFLDLLHNILEEKIE